MVRLHTRAMDRTQPNQLLAVELICAAEVMDDFSDRLARGRVSFVMGQLVVFGGGAVLIFSLSSSQVHALCE